MFKHLIKLTKSTNLLNINQFNRLNLIKTLSNKSFNETDLNYDVKLTIELQKQYGEETIENKRSRLLYQSRKRGMLENGLLLSCFANRYLKDFNSIQLEEYDYLINKVSNEWDLYYWLVDKDQVPDEFNSSVFKLLKEFSSNAMKESRIYQPPLN